MATVTNLTLPALIKTLGRHYVQGASGLCLKVLDDRRAYWCWRFRINGREREISLGSARKVTLSEARDQQRRLHVGLIDGVDPLTSRRSVRQAEVIDALLAKRVRLDRAESPGLTHLYRCYDHAGKLLYVGMSGNSLDRWMSHKRKSPWSDDVALMTVDHYPTKEAAIDAEAEVILTEKPPLNLTVALNRKRADIERRSASPAEIKRLLKVKRDRAVSDRQRSQQQDAR